MSERGESEWKAMQQKSHDPVKLLNAARARLADPEIPAEEAAFWKHVVDDLVGRAAEHAWTFQLRQ